MEIGTTQATQGSPPSKVCRTPSTGHTEIGTEEHQVREFILLDKQNGCSDPFPSFVNPASTMRSVLEQQEQPKTQKHPTDRFIPLRKTASDGMALIGAKPPSGSESTIRKKKDQKEQGKVKMDQMFKAVMLDHPLDNKKMFSFSQSLLIQKPFGNKSLLDATGQRINNFQTKELSNRKTRKIDKLPYKVLDAPKLSDDFYLNLLEWSSKNILSVALESNLYFWNANNNNVTRFLDTGSSMITSINWNSDGNHIAVGDTQGIVQIWDVNKQTKVRQLNDHASRVSAISWSRGDLIATGSRDKTIKVSDFRMKQNAYYHSKGHNQQICGLKWSLDGSMLASGGNDNKLIVWSNQSQTPLYKFSHHTAAVKGLTWNPHNHGVLLSGGGSADKTIKFWNTLNGTLMQSIDTGSQVCNLAFSTQTREFVSTHGYSKNQIIVWNYQSLEKVSTLSGHTSRVLYLALSPNGENIVTGAGDQTLRFWNVFPQSSKKSSKKGALSTLDLR